jgi:hypothetical protein
MHRIASLSLCVVTLAACDGAVDRSAAAADSGTFDGGGGPRSAPMDASGNADAAAAPGGLLTFAVFGDCRPPDLEDTSRYPTQIVNGIFTLAQTSGAQFAIGTGDYMFTNTSSGVAAQLQMFAQARAKFNAGPVYLAMGNHECTGYTASNCPNLDETPNVQAFMAQLVPSGVTTPYYRFDLPTPLGKAKFIVTAANAWDAAQESWLKTQLADATTYTFVVRHEPAADTQAPGVSPSEALIAQYPLTLELNGHTHEYRRVTINHVISGNAGAPLQAGSGSTYGFLMLRQQANGNINVTEIEEATANATDTWTVTADGKAAP